MNQIEELTANAEGAEGAVPADAITAALTALTARRQMYDTFRAYYNGTQPLTYASNRFRDAFARLIARYAENMCPAVVDTMADRLIVSGFELETGIDVEGGETAPEQTQSEAAKAAMARLWAIWLYNSMTLRAGAVHKTAAQFGDAYVIVWPDPARPNVPRIYPQEPEATTVHYDPETEAIDWGAKWWLQDDKRARLNLYYRDRIEKYVSSAPIRGDRPARTTRFIEWPEEPLVQNPYGVVPVFHFGNNVDLATFGVSDLRDVLPIQDGLNKAVADMLVGMEFAAFPQRWATGLQTNTDDDGKPISPYIPGADRLWTNSDTDARFGQFDAADLEQMIAVQNRFKNAIADVTGIPSHYLQMTITNWPSGESLKTAESRFVAKIRDRQIAFGNVWEAIAYLCAAIAGFTIPGEITAVWSDASPRSERDQAETLILKKSLGLSDDQALREAGYSEEQIEDMRRERAEERDAAAEREAQRLNRFAFNPDLNT